MVAKTVTLDTNVVYEWLKTTNASPDLQQLLELSSLGKIDLAVTRRIEADIPNEPLATRVKALKEIGINKRPSVTRLERPGFRAWVLGEDLLGDDEFARFSEYQKTKEPDWRDWDHVHAHYLLKRHVFLTYENSLLRLTETLRMQFGIALMAPGVFLQQFGATNSNTVTAQPPSY